jgi:hypothetical protein
MAVQVAIVVGGKEQPFSAGSAVRIVQDGAVTLKGPVRSEEEKQAIEAKAVAKMRRARVHAA